MPKPPGYENLVECPYNRAHQIENGGRFQIHLEKCRREYVKLHSNIIKQCPFNATHMINEPEFLHHVDNCRDRVQVDKFKSPIFDHPEAIQKQTAIKMIPKQAADAFEEDWDSEPPTPAYNPSKYCETNDIVRLCNGMQPHERKAFRQKEHARLESIREVKY